MYFASFQKIKNCRSLRKILKKADLNFLMATLNPSCFGPFKWHQAHLESSQGLTQVADDLRMGTERSVRRSTHSSGTGCTGCPSGPSPRSAPTSAAPGETRPPSMSGTRDYAYLGSIANFMPPLSESADTKHILSDRFSILIKKLGKLQDFNPGPLDFHHVPTSKSKVEVMDLFSLIK